MLTMIMLEIQIATQKLLVIENDQLVTDYPISTSTKGGGELLGSMQTPRGWHKIRAKIGGSCPINTVFVSRRPTGEIYKRGMKDEVPKRDWILTRIMWLSGLELGKNRLGDVDTMRRYVYIHGIPDEIQLGVPRSKGCINMRNKDIVHLFDKVPAGTRVLINE